MHASSLPPNQQLVAADKWPAVGERAPRRDDGPWHIQVSGAVARPCTLALGELRAMPQVEQIVDIHCVTRWSKPGVRFSGVPLAALLATALPEPAARFVSFVARSARGHSTSLLLNDALGLNTLLALAADGAPLPEVHGGPVRIVVPGRYFYKSLKWLERIELLAEDCLGFWESTAGYHNSADPWLEQRYMAPGLSKAEARALLASRDIRRRDLRSLDARGHDLAGLAADEARLRDADFRGCRLQRACFDGANLSNAHLQDADLRDATFRQADVEGANFAGADLRGACFVGASLFGASFCHPAGGGVRGVALDERTEIPAAALDDLTPVQQSYLRAVLAAVGAGH